MGLQVGQVLRQAALAAPERVAIVDLGAVGTRPRTVSYAELDRLALRVAERLQLAGVQRGDRVGLLAENSLECVAAWFGVVYAGAAVVPLHVLSAAPELRIRIVHAGCRVLIHDEARAALAGAVTDAASGTAEPGATQVGTAQSASGAPATGCTARSLAELTAESTAALRLTHPADLPPGAPAMVLYTSGTTGSAKGAVISHASLLLHTSVLSSRVLNLDAEAVVLCVLPLSHSYGCRMALLAPFFGRGRVVIMPRFDAARSLQVLHDHAITWLPGVPTMFAAWAEQPAGPAPTALRWALSAGAPLADEVARRAELRLGTQVRQGYGMTEATFCAINAPPDQRVLGSVGRPVWGIELRIVDAAGRDAARGESGEVLVRGHNVMSHYLDDPAATAEISSDGFLHSGDVGRLDEQGRLFVVDRIKDLIIRGGYNVYPSEIESVLQQHPSVAEAAVVGQPDTFYGEEVAAVIVARAACSARELSEFASARLGRMRRPRLYAFVEALPLGPSGKVHKRSLRERIAAGEIALESVD